tara:strand:+ start:826 stop:2310 length:1485 start_codon:yes stop_codon:yes gene_type:complete
MKQFLKNFNNLIKKTIFKVQKKTNNNFIISNFNKYLITFIGLLFFYLFYLLTPLLYEKNWVQSNIESKLFNEFKINLSTSANISYRIFPAPHFLIKDSKIMVNDEEKQKSIAEIKDLKIFISQLKFLDKKKLYIKKIIINDANFSLLRNDIKLLTEFRKNKLSSKKIIVNSSNIFIKDNLNEIIAIIKIDKARLFFEDERLINLLKLNGEVFNIPFTFSFKKKMDAIKNEEIKFNAKSLKLNILNISTKEKNNQISGQNVISFLKSKISTKYKIQDELILLNSNNAKINNLQFNYAGYLSINPFDLDLNINLENHKIAELLNINSILTELIKSELLFNNNISVKTSIVANSNLKNKIFQKAKINFSIINGKINFNNTRFVNESIGSLELNKSNLFLKNNRLILNTDVIIDIRDSGGLFSFLKTSKKLRKKIKSVLINLDYDYLSSQIKFNSLKIDNNEVNAQFLNLIGDFDYMRLNNLNRSRRLINKLLANYDG